MKIHHLWQVALFIAPLMSYSAHASDSDASTPNELTPSDEIALSPEYSDELFDENIEVSEENLDLLENNSTNDDTAMMPGMGPRPAPGGSHPSPGFGPRPSPGFGPRPSPGFGPRPSPGFGPHPAPGFGPHPAPGFGPHPAPGFGPHPAPGFGPHPGFGPRPGFGHPGYSPYPIHGGHRPWPRWNRPHFPRPSFNFDWYRVRMVTCDAQDSYGNIYAVTEDSYSGFLFRDRINEIEDAALDRCYHESNGDSSCQLLGCRAGY